MQMSLKVSDCPVLSMVEEKGKPTSGLHFCWGPGVVEASHSQLSSTPVSPQVPGLQSPERLSPTLFPSLYAFILYKYQLWYFVLAAVAAREMAGLTCGS